MARLREGGYAVSVQLEIRPEPPEPVRRAIAAALAAAREPGQESAWWRAGLEELREGEDDQAGARPRNSPGAARA
jgi:hypothetical protein